MLEILLLGEPRVINDGEDIVIKRRMARGFLYYLAGCPNIVSRTELILQFWPDEPEENAKRHMREILSKLRNQLPDPEHIIVENNQIGLDFDRSFSDVLEFEKLYDHATRLSNNYPRNTPLPNSIYQQILKAVNLWRTPNFVDGDSMPANPGFENWYFEMNNRLSCFRLSLLDRLADHYAAIGDLEAAVRHIRKVVIADIYDQKANVKLLNWLQDIGRIREARAHCIYISDIAEKDSSFQLSDELQKACNKVNDQTQIPNPGLPKWPAPFSITVPYVGHKKLLNNIRKNFYQGGTSVVFGEAGAGKTRLIYEFYHTAQPTPRLLFARSNPSESMLPYQVFIDMVRSSIFKEEWAALDSIWLCQLAPLFPELHAINPDADLDKKWAKQSQSLILEAFYQIFQIVARSGRLLVVLDDAQWCDEGTLSIFKFLMERKFFKENGLFFVSVRDERDNFKIEKFLRNVKDQHNLHQYYLDLLKEEEAAELIRLAIGQEPSLELLQKIMHDTGGNPLFILEMLRASMEEFPVSLISEKFKGIKIPQNIYTLIRERLWGIDSDIWQVLSTAAVIGNQFTPELVEKATSLGPEKVVYALEELEKGHLIRPDREGSASGHYNFIHNKIREIIVTDLSQARKRMIHQNVADAYEKRAGKNSILAGLIAYHYTEAFNIKDGFNFWIQAGNYSYNLFSIEEANNAYSQAEKLLTNFPSYIDDAGIYELYSNWGAMARDVLDLGLMCRLYRTLRGLGEERSNTRLIGCASNGLGLASLLADKDEEGMDYAEQAFAYLKDSDDSYELAKTYNLLGNLYVCQNMFSKAKNAYQSSLKLSKDTISNSKLAKVAAEAKHQLSLVFIYCGYPLRAIARAEESLDTKSKIMYSPGVLRASYVLGLSKYYAGQFAGAYEQCEPKVHTAEKMHKWYTMGLLLQVMTSVDLIRGDLDKALRHINELSHIGNKYDLSDLVIDANLLLGDFYRLMRDYPKAAEFYSYYSQRTDYPFRSLFYKVRKGAALYTAVLSKEGLTILEDAILEAKTSRMDTVYFLGETVKNLADFLNGKYDGLEENVDKIRQLTKSRSLETTSITSLWIQGELAYTVGNFDKAEKYANELMDQTNKMTHFWLKLRGNVLLHRINKVRKTNDDHYYNTVMNMLSCLDKKVREKNIIETYERFKEKVISSMS